MKIISHVMRNVNEFNIPAGTSRGYEMLYFGVNLILMIDYRLAFDIIPAESNYEVEVLIVSRRDVDKWKVSHSQSDINTFYCNQGGRINDIFKPAQSDSYAFIIINKSQLELLTVGVTLIHTWQQRIKESQIIDE